MLNAVWVFMVLSAIVSAAISQRLDLVAEATVKSATGAVELALGFVGVMTFWLGLVKVLEKGGLLLRLVRILRPVMKRLFPDVPENHPAMAMMVMNMASNIIGLDNAATPFGVKAMSELNKLNRQEGTATNAMVMFLAINTSGLAVLPTSMIALRASLGSASPGAVVITTLCATCFSTLVGIAVASVLQNRKAYALHNSEAPAATNFSLLNEDVSTGTIPAKGATSKSSKLGLLAGFVVFAAFGFAYMQLAIRTGWFSAFREAGNQWALLGVIAAIVVFGISQKVDIYDAMVEGGKEGFHTAVRVIPYLVVILTGVGMLRSAGGLDLLVKMLGPVTALVGMPPETLPLALLRPLSGQGSYGLAADIMREHGPDSLIGAIASTMMGSTETTFYVLALYLGTIQVRRSRHAVPACLAADAAGLLMSVWVCRFLV